MKKDIKYKYKPKKNELLGIPNRKDGYIRDLGTINYVSAERKRREFGAHLTSLYIYLKNLFFQK